MGYIENKLMRFACIDQAIHKFGKPTKRQILDFVNKETQREWCFDLMTKDIDRMRHEYHAPIKCENERYFYSDPSFEFWAALLSDLANYVQFPKAINKEIFKTKDDE